jgi:hypothetical protein
MAMLLSDSDLMMQYIAAIAVLLLSYFVAMQDGYSNLMIFHLAPTRD